MRWGEKDAPKVTILGKGVCFDSGGLDLKHAAGMRSMKKDMGGAAAALSLAKLIAARSLPIQLRVLIPAVENAVSGNAYHPGDVIRTYKGITVDVGNTDAEGRLILCDALALAAKDKPELMVDYATLTGAARIALGTELSAMFCNNDELAQGIEKAAKMRKIQYGACLCFKAIVSYLKVQSPIFRTSVQYLKVVQLLQLFSWNNLLIICLGFTSILWVQIPVIVLHIHVAGKLWPCEPYTITLQIVISINDKRRINARLEFNPKVMSYEYSLASPTMPDSLKWQPVQEEQPVPRLGADQS